MYCAGMKEKKKVASDRSAKPSGSKPSTDKSAKSPADSKIKVLDQKWSERFNRLEALLLVRTLGEPQQESTFQTVKPQILHVLYEHASGYALFRVKEFEELGMPQPEVEESVKDLSRFNAIVKLVGFSPFRSGTNALDNINSISEGVLHEDLKLFLDTNVPKTSKKQKSVVGVADSKISVAINEELGLTCQHTGVVPEIIRGIRVHFHKFVKGLTEVGAAKAQLGLGHSYSRAKVKFNVHRADNMIIQSISLLDQLDKDVNTFSMRIREWYSYHFPELVKIVNDNYTYAKVAKLIKDRKSMTEETIEALEDIVMDSAKAQAIYDASKMSMGMDISPFDLINIERFTDRVIALTEYRKSLHSYLSDKMTDVAPNLSALIGEQVGARLISHAGSLTNLAKYPASTVQILGAEKALFRALKTRGNTPKYGLIFHSTFIGRAASKNKGRVSRYLANKCSIASRIDCFSEIPTSVFGEHLKNQVENRLMFYESGETPQKNNEVMHAAMEEAKLVQQKLAKKEKKKKKKDKKRKMSEVNGDITMDTTANETLNSTADITLDDGETPKKKKKNKKQEAQVTMDTSQQEEPVKKKKKKKEEADVSMDTSMIDGTEEAQAAESGKKKKKKKHSIAMETSLDETVEETPGKKKKKGEGQVTMDTSLNDTAEEGAESPVKKMKKKKKKKDADD